jgi:hypothetical protein
MRNGDPPAAEPRLAVDSVAAVKVHDRCSANGGSWLIAKADLTPLAGRHVAISLEANWSFDDRQPTTITVRP